MVEYLTVTKCISEAPSLPYAEEYDKDNKRDFFLRFPYEGVLVSMYSLILIF